LKYKLVDIKTMDSVSGALHITYGSNPKKANQLAFY